MIDPLHEKLITFAEAARLCPGRRNGRKPHVATFHRWATDGCRGVYLETTRVGGTKVTSAEAVARFFTRLAETDLPKGVTPVTASRTPGPVRGSALAGDVERELDREGLTARRRRSQPGRDVSDGDPDRPDCGSRRRGPA